jgi:hypothetical protein
MATLQIRIIDGNTVTDRDMNAEELATYKAMQDDIKAQAEAQAERAAARQAVLDKLGLTADEAAALLG